MSKSFFYLWIYWERDLWKFNKVLQKNNRNLMFSNNLVVFTSSRDDCINYNLNLELQIDFISIGNLRKLLVVYFLNSGSLCMFPLQYLVYLPWNWQLSNNLPWQWRNSLPCFHWVLELPQVHCWRRAHTAGFHLCRR